MIRPSCSLFVAVAFSSLAVACANGQPELQGYVEGGPIVTVEAGTEPPPRRDASLDAPPPRADADDTAEKPEVTSVAPNESVVGSVGPTVVVTGKWFVPRSVVQLDGAALPTTFVGATELRATVPTAKLNAVGVHRVSVGTAPPGGGASGEVDFAVVNPKPTLSGLTPTSALLGASGAQLTVNGSGFVSGAKVVFDGTDLPTNLGGAGMLTASIPSSKLQISGTFPVTVVNPAPGGGASQSIAFTVANPTVTLAAVSPSQVIVGSPSVNVTLSGAGFVSASSVSFNGAAIASTFVSGSSLTATVPAASLSSAGSFPLVVTNPAPGGGVSLPLQLRVEYPAPTVASALPAGAVAGAGATQIEVTGGGFYAASQLTFDGAPTATTYVDGAHLRATLTAAQLASAGTISIRATNPSPGGGTSGALGFVVSNPAPLLTSMTPSFAAVGSPDFPVTLTGAGFVTASVVRANGANLPTAFMSPTQVRATVPAALIASPGAIAITVQSPAPGGGTSAALALTVGCDPTGVDVGLGVLNTVTTLATNFQGASSRYSTSSACPASLTSSNQQPFRAWVVQNTAGVPVTLSAWAVCRSISGQQDDGYVALYRRATVPASDADRQACTGVVSEGLSGFGGYESPEPGVSAWCPGLTRANGGGLALGVCEKAVVYVQPWSNTSTTYTPPQTIRLKPE